MFVLRKLFFITLTLYFIGCKAKSDCKSKNAQNGICENNKENVNLYEEEDEESIEDVYKKYSAEINQGDYDDDSISNEKFCLPAEFSEAGISKLSVVPTHKSRINYLENPNPEIKLQKTAYEFGSTDYQIVSEIGSWHNGTEKFNVTIDVCYPKEKNMKTKICSILGIEAVVLTESSEDNIKLISGELYEILEKGQQICVRIEANDTYSYKVAVGFYGIKKDVFEEALLDVYSSEEVTKEVYDEIKESISNTDMYERLKFRKMLNEITAYTEKLHNNVETHKI